MKLKSLRHTAIPLLVLSSLSMAHANDGDDDGAYADNFLFGDWAGSRTRMADSGYEFEFVYTTDFYNLDYDDGSGTNTTDSVDLNNTDITLTIDADKAWGLDNTTVFIYFLGNNGQKPTDQYVGDQQTFTNIETASTFKLHEFWYQKNFAEDKFSVLFGLWDLNSEFDVIETAGLFSGSSHGIAPEFSQVEGGPSIFATVSLSLRAIYNPSDQIYTQAVILDAVPGDPNDPDNLDANITLDATDGYLIAVEVGHVSKDDDPYHKMSLGYWTYTKPPLQNVKDGGANADVINTGIYVSGDFNVYQEGGDPAQGINVFARYGVAEDKINEILTYNGAGIVYTGLIPGRDDDQFGIGIAIANPTDSHAAANPGTSASETAIEISYFTQVTPWLGIKPDYQIIENPGLNSSKNTATVIGARFEISF